MESEAAERTIAAIRDRLITHRGPFVVAVDGGSGAGKSTLATSMAAELGASVVQADDFFASDRTGAEWDRCTAAEKAALALDWRRLRAEALEPLRAGREARWHPFDFVTYEYATGSALATEVVTRPPTRVIILEGIYSCRPELSDLIDLSVLVQAPAVLRQHRHNEREARDESEWHRRWDEAEDYYFAQVRPPGSYDLVVSAAAELPSAPNSLELALFGTTEPSMVERLVDEYCRREVGAGVTSVIFHRVGVASVHGVALTDGRQVVVKVHRPLFAGRLEAVQEVQAHLARQGFPCPQPLAGPSPIGKGVGTAESLLNHGSIADAHNPTVRAVLARGLLDLVRACDQLVGSVDPGAFWLVAADGLWPPPHDMRFDFERTAEGAEWIDHLAQIARDRLRAPAGRLVIGHIDWRVENLRVKNRRIVAVYDWESLALLPEPVLVGAVAHAFTASWDVDWPFDIPSLEESRAFISDYEKARGSGFDAEELEASMLDTSMHSLMEHGASIPMPC